MTTLETPAEVDPVAARFASRSLPVHLARGAVGIALAVLAIVLAATVHPAWLLLAIGSVVAWRGCVSCWTLGYLALRDARR